MTKVHKSSDYECHPPSTELFKFYNQWCTFAVLFWRRNRSAPMAYTAKVKNLHKTQKGKVFPLKKTKLHGLSPRANYTDRPSDRRLSAKSLPTCADRGCHVISVTDPSDRILGFLDRSRYFFYQVAPQLYSRG
jgi:hypothetical protein